jgi:hypothetical protein
MMGKGRVGASCTSFALMVVSASMTGDNWLELEEANIGETWALPLGD